MCTEEFFVSIKGLVNNASSWVGIYVGLLANRPTKFQQ